MLLVIETRERSETHRLEQGRTVIGRDKHCDILVDHLSLSRRHFECEVSASGIFIRDLGSKNGTFIGDRKVTSAPVNPGDTVRAGEVKFHFKAEPVISDETVAWRPEEMQSAEPLTQGIETQPDAEDDEMTPASAIPAVEEGARLVVRGDRWFAVDPISGEEVEIVARNNIGGSEDVSTGIVPAAHAQVPARRAQVTAAAEYVPRASHAVPVGQTGLGGLFATRGRRIILALSVLFLIIVVAVVVLLTRKPEVYRMSVGDYLKASDQAMIAYNAGQHDDAIEQLRRLLTAPLEQRRNLAQMLLDAIAADDKARLDNSGESTDKALDRWDEIVKSRESTPAIKEVAQARFGWLRDAQMYFALVNDARRDLDNENVQDALRKAASVPEGSPSSEKAAAIIDEALEAGLRKAEDAASQKEWNTAIDMLIAVLEVAPDERQQVEPKIREYRQFEGERQNLIKARELQAAGKYSDALALLTGVDEGPYVAEASTLAKSILREDATKNAERLIDSGEGQAALKLLTDAGMGESPLALRARTILGLREKYLESVKANDFEEAEEALNSIIRQENIATSRYAQEAKRNLDSLPITIQNAASLLADKADDAVKERDYRTARKSYETALLLDPTSLKAREGIKNLEAGAIRDYNVALGMPRDNPDPVLQLLYDVRDRLPSTHRLYSRVESDIFRITNLKTGQETE